MIVNNREPLLTFLFLFLLLLLLFFFFRIFDFRPGLVFSHINELFSVVGKVREYVRLGMAWVGEVALHEDGGIDEVDW